jgi:hypothetical protein
MLVSRGGTLVLSFRFTDSDVVKIGRTEYDHQIAPCLFADSLSVFGNFGGVSDPFTIPSEILLHRRGHPVFQRHFDLAGGLIRHALFPVGAVGGAAEVELWVGESMATHRTSAFRIILEKFHFFPTDRTRNLKYGSRFPVTGVLSRALHFLCLNGI